MKLTIVIAGPIMAILYMGCQNPGAVYVKQHPELSPQQRQIFIEKKVTDVLAVAGLTKAQIRVALGEPTQFDNIEGAEAWIYARSNQPAVSRLGVAGGDLGGTAIPEKSAGPNLRTTIFFEEDRAVRATVANE